MALKITDIGELTTFNSDKNRIIRMTGMDMIIEEERISEIDEGLPDADEKVDASGRLVTPGFVDAHTHSVFAKARADEFGMRISGKSYQEIADQGGGIRASVKAVREMPEQQLLELTKNHLEDFLSLGTTTVEAKSGYGLSTESELKSLMVLSKAADSVAINVVPTFLGAHDFPHEFADNRRGYVDLICDEMIPAVTKQGIAQFCDVFCENGWFDVESSRRILETGKEHGLKPRLHADEFVASGAAELAAEVDAFSADHLMHVSDEGIRKMAEAGVVAILLPGTTFFLGKQTYAPARKLMDAGVEVAVATDFNPGSCSIQSMPFIMNLSCLYLGMSVEESFKGATHVAAKSLGWENKVGSLEVGMEADVVIWDVDRLEGIPYHVGGNKVHKVIKSGRTEVDGGK